jgi:C4-dicarboxylate-specific signal transduction histidine kinase
MATPWKILLRQDAWRAMPAPIYTALVAQLFRPSPTVNIGEAVLVGLIGGLAAWRSSDGWLGILTLLTCWAIVMILPAGKRWETVSKSNPEPAEVRRIEHQFEIQSWAISAGIGLMAARAVLASNDTLVHLMMIAVMLGATTTNIRYHYRPRLTFGKTVAINLPLVVVAPLTGNPYYIALGVSAIIAASVFLEISRDLYSASEALLRTLRDKDVLATELEIKNHELRQRERQRTEAETALRGVQADLIHVSRITAMGTMASTLAHELNQPLTAVTNYIRGCRRLLAGSGKDKLAAASDAMDSAEASASRAAMIVRRLRTLVFRGDIDTRTEDLPELIRAACDLAFLDAHIRQVDHELDFHPDACWVDVDGIQVQQVMINLIRNAVEAMEHSPQRHIRIATSVESDDFVMVSVTDTGPGLTPSQRDTLFSSFQSSKPQGLGIGLSICRTIVEAHGGRIWAESAAGKGSTFLFSLPISDP